MDPVHPGLTTQTVLAVGASSDQPVNIFYSAAVSDWEGAVSQSWTDHRWVVELFRLLAPVPGTHRNDLLKHAGPKQLPKQSCRQRQIKPALRDDSTHYFDLNVKVQLQVKVRVPPHWTAEGTCVCFLP